MYNSPYEEYMRNVLGHSYKPGNTYEQFDYNYYDKLQLAKWELFTGFLKEVRDVYDKRILLPFLFYS